MWAGLLAAYQTYQAGQKTSSGSGNAPGEATSGLVKAGADIDFSGFTASTGSSRAYGASIKKNAADDGVAGLADAMPGSTSPIVLLGLGGLALLVAWSIFKRK